MLLLNDDNTVALNELDAGSIQLTFTSPPYYNARDYSVYDSYESYLEAMGKTFEQVYRVTEAGRFCVINTSPVIEPRAKRSQSSKRYPIPFDMHSILKAIGWEFLDDIIWLKPEGAAANRNAGFSVHRRPMAYKPNLVTEYVMVYRKPNGNKLIDHSIRQYPNDLLDASLVGGDYERSNVWKISPASSKLHPAIFPDKLCENVIRYYSFVDDSVLDPFAGIGTVGRIALALKRSPVLIEQHAPYFDTMTKSLLPLFLADCV